MADSTVTPNNRQAVDSVHCDLPQPCKSTNKSFFKHIVYTTHNSMPTITITDLEINV